MDTEILAMMLFTAQIVKTGLLETIVSSLTQKTPSMPKIWLEETIKSMAMEATIISKVALAMICYMEAMVMMSFTAILVMTPYTVEQEKILSMEMIFRATD